MFEFHTASQKPLHHSSWRFEINSQSDRSNNLTKHNQETRWKVAFFPPKKKNTAVTARRIQTMFSQDKTLVNLLGNTFVQTQNENNHSEKNKTKQKITCGLRPHLHGDDILITTFLSYSSKEVKTKQKKSQCAFFFLNPDDQEVAI